MPRVGFMPATVSWTTMRFSWATSGEVPTTACDSGISNGVTSIKMDPCRRCWARYLCGGGSYHEVAKRGRPGCDFIRGWLEYCLMAYTELSAVSPHGLFGRQDGLNAASDIAIFAS